MCDALDESFDEDELELSEEGCLELHVKGELYKQTIIMKPYHYIEALSQKRGFVSLFALTLRFQKCPLWRARFMLDRVGRHTYVALGGVCRARQNTRLIT